jgi:hypothetical protein
MNIVLFVGKITNYDADMHTEIAHVRLRIISKMFVIE